MRWLLLLLALPIAGCPETQVAPATPTPAHPPKPLTCLAQPSDGSSSAPLERVGIVGRELRFCRDEGTAAGLRCYGFDLDTGALTRADALAEPVDAPEFPRRVSVDDAHATAKLCDKIGSACRALDLGRARVRVEQAALSDSQRMLAVTTEPPEGGVATATIFDTASGRPLGRFTINPTDEYECGRATFVGETILALEDVCAGPAGVAWLAKPDTGHRIAWIGGRPGWGAWEVERVHVRGPLWAFREERGVEVVVQNVATGEVTQRFDLRDTFPLDAYGEPIANPSGGFLLRTARGELVVVHDDLAQGTVLVLDPLTGARRATLVMPPCPPAGSTQHDGTL